MGPGSVPNEASKTSLEPKDELLALEPALRRYFRRRVPADQVDDLVQDVFLNLKARRSEAPIESLDRYLFTVAGHVLARARRAEGRRRRLHLDDEADEDLEASPERIVLGREELTRAMAVIANLPSRTKQVFVLHRFEEMSYKSIGVALGISVSAVEKHIMSALRALTTDGGQK